MKFQILILIAITNIKAEGGDDETTNPDTTNTTDNVCYKDFLRSYNLLANDKGTLGT